MMSSIKSIFSSQTRSGRPKRKRISPPGDHKQREQRLADLEALNSVAKDEEDSRQQQPEFQRMYSSPWERRRILTEQIRHKKEAVKNKLGRGRWDQMPK